MGDMRRGLPISLALIALALWPAVARAADPSATATPSPSAGPAPQILVLKVEGAIDRPLYSYLNQRLGQAEADGMMVVLQVDTSGTLDQDGVALANRVAGMSVPVLVWVGPAPAQASGAGRRRM